MDVTHQGAKLPMFIPCIGGRCPERMRLEQYDSPTPVYRCMRRVGFAGRTGETYSGDCEHHTHPYPANDYAYWHRDPDKKRRLDPTTMTDRDWETVL